MDHTVYLTYLKGVLFMDVDFHPHTKILFATTELCQQKIAIWRSVDVCKVLKKNELNWRHNIIKVKELHTGILVEYLSG